MGTFATPCTLSRRDWIVQYVISDMSMTDIVWRTCRPSRGRGNRRHHEGGAAQVGATVHALAFPHELTRPHQVGVGLEDQLDLREPGTDPRTQDIEALDTGQRLLEGTVTNASTSPADVPSAAVWTRPAGEFREDVHRCRAASTPKNIVPAAIAMTRNTIPAKHG
jgi:hypothetical protein